MKLVEYHDIISKEESFWRQKSRKIFLKEGDRNSKYFFMTTIKHRMGNKISRLKIDGVISEKEEDFRGDANKFFFDLLKKVDNLDKDHQRELLDCIPHILEEE